MSRMKDKYRNEVVASLKERGEYENVMEVPRIEKVVLNIGVGEAIQNAKALEGAETDLAAIAGQHPITTRAKKSIANFRLREGMKCEEYSEACNPSSSRIPPVPAINIFSYFSEWSFFNV